MPDMPKVPDGWTLTAVPGWPTNKTWQPTLERVGNVLLPQAFSAHVHAIDESDLVWLCMVVDDGEVKMSAVMSAYDDVAAALDRVRAAAPMEVWTRLAVTKMTHWLAVTTPDELADVFARTKETYGNEWWIPATKAWQRQLGGEAAANSARATDMPLSRKRNRITREHLEEVAKVYRRADAAGAPPTRAVEQAFSTSHSTAAKWVAHARKQGILGPPPGSRGGEVNNPAAAVAARPIAEAAARPLANRVSKTVAESIRQRESGEDGSSQ
jgi:hypothetical protein